jgi:hypothetical protein
MAVGANLPEFQMESPALSTLRAWKRASGHINCDSEHAMSDVISTSSPVFRCRQDAMVGKRSFHYISNSFVMGQSLSKLLKWKAADKHNQRHEQLHDDVHGCKIV